MNFSAQQQGRELWEACARVNLVDLAGATDEFNRCVRVLEHFVCQTRCRGHCVPRICVQVRLAWNVTRHQTDRGSTCVSFLFPFEKPNVRRANRKVVTQFTSVRSDSKQISSLSPFGSCVPLTVDAHARSCIICLRW